MATEPTTKAYAARRNKEGKQKKFIIRCLKRYVAHEIYAPLPRPELPLTT